MDKKSWKDDQKKVLKLTGLTLFLFLENKNLPVVFLLYKLTGVGFEPTNQRTMA
jgi:hypothetical protein